MRLNNPPTPTSLLSPSLSTSSFFFFFFNDTATTEIYPLSLHDALPICQVQLARRDGTRRHVDEDRAGKIARKGDAERVRTQSRLAAAKRDRKSTRLNSSHGYISYAVFCLKKKKKIRQYYKICD